MSHETWKPVYGFEALYEVSDKGNVRSLPRSATKKNRVYGGASLRATDQNGYKFVSLSNKGPGNKVLTRRVHRLVMEAFIGPRLAGMVIRHLNGNPSDNRLSNLAYGTYKDNEADKLAHGRRLTGERHPCAKLTQADVDAIRASYGIVPQVEMAKRYGIGAQAINAIIRGRAWCSK